MALTHQGSKVLVTPRLLLRPVTLDDAPELFACCLSDPQVTRFISIPTHHEVAETKAMLEKNILGYEKPEHYYWAIVPQDTGRLAGIFLAFNNDERSHKCEVGYYLCRACWGQGLVSEALMAVTNFLFSQVGFMRLEARCDAVNGASARVLTKCGFIYEGCKRKDFYNNEGRYIDSNFYGLLREDWQPLT